MHVTHSFGAWFDDQSRVLILGTMPSPKSREAGFYYAHPQNRFWRVLPSTSPANCAVKLEQLLERYAVIRQITDRRKQTEL